MKDEKEELIQEKEQLSQEKEQLTGEKEEQFVHEKESAGGLEDAAAEREIQAARGDEHRINDQYKIPDQEYKRKYTDLEKQEKKCINQWLYEEICSFYLKYYCFPEGPQMEGVIQRVCARIKAADIRISFEEAAKHCRKKRKKVCRKVYADRLPLESRGTQPACFTNMCMVIDGQGNVAALDKKTGGYVGLTFPGGHVEPGETFYESVIREVREETGLEIANPLFCGMYHWYKENVHHVILLYRAEEYTGSLQSSQEGQVFWIPLDEYRKKELAEGMAEVLQIVCDQSARECFMKLEQGRYRAYMY